MNTKPQHTPGPWNAAQKNEIMSRGLVRDTQNRLVCDCDIAESGDIVGRSPQEIDATARLIAAAPDLLAACKSLMQVLGETITEYAPNEYCQAQYAEMHDAKIAIDKAEGGTKNG